MTVSTLVRSIVGQLIGRLHQVPPHVMHVMDQSQSQLHEAAKNAAVQEILVYLVSTIFRATYLVLDAADECKEDVLSSLVRILHGAGPRLCIWVTSRRVEIDLTLLRPAEFEVSGNVVDFKAYLDYRIINDPSLARWARGRLALHVHIRDTIAEAADGM
jgi:hypothetical protein